MNIELLRDYCINKDFVTEGLPFGDDTLVFKVKNKMFALANLEGPLRISLKCDPEIAIELRERYPAVMPGYHLNKQHWNTVSVDGTIDNDSIFKWIDQSYDLILASIPKKNK